MPSSLSFGLSRDKRLRKSWEFDNVFRTGRREKGELVRLYFVKGAPGAPKFGAAVGKKIADAVQRARGRRMIRESMRRIMPWMRDGARLVVSLNEKGLSAGADGVYLDIAKAMFRRSLLKEDWPGPDWSVDSGR